MSDSGGKPGEKQTGAAVAASPADKPEARKSAKLVPLRPRRKCPICGKKATHLAYPFCSVRCADSDLDRWLSGRYRIAGSADDGDVPSGEASSASHASEYAPDED